MLIEVLLAGLRAVGDYIALHVLTCLIPAFLLAGALVTFISKDAVMERLGAGASKLLSLSVLGCNACMELCPVQAISFPTPQELRETIRRLRTGQQTASPDQTAPAPGG